MIGRLLEWIDKPKRVYTNNLSYIIGEFCFWYVLIDIVRMVWF